MMSKKDFLKDILNYYNEIKNDSIPNQVIERLSKYLSDHFYYRYKEFRRKYPKSKKRYSKMKIKDLETAYSYDKIIFFLKKYYIEDYKMYCSIFFKMSEEDFIAYERSRENFYDMF